MEGTRIQILISIAALAIAPSVVNNNYLLYILTMCCIWSVITTQWNLIMGFVGIFSFAQISFFTIGAYTSAILSVSIHKYIYFPIISPWIDIVFAGAVTGLAGIAIGLLTLRLKGIYVALFTFAFQIVLGVLITHSELCGSYYGIKNVPPFQIGSLNFGGQYAVPNYLLSIVLLLISMYSIHIILRSRIGLAFRAIRDNEVLAISRGVNPHSYKLLAFFISAFFTGLIGGFFSHFIGVTTRGLLEFDWVVTGIAMIVIGGLGTEIGPVIGAFILTALTELLRPTIVYRFLILGAMITAMILILPEGLWKILDYLRSISRATKAH